MLPNTKGLSLSVVLLNYNMKRELPRTLMSMSPQYQLGIDASEYEVVVVDNGSDDGFDESCVPTLNSRAKFVRYANPSRSPVDALNWGVSITSGRNVCVCIDAARMASPGLLAAGIKATQLDQRAVVGALSYHLGKRPQNISVPFGYNQVVEDDLLEGTNWYDDGYRLFTISSFDPSSRFGYGRCPAETNSLFMPRHLWEQIGGYEPRFASSGGGLANLDIWARVCNDPENLVVVLLGEGTFHQFHGGTTTNAGNKWKDFNEEYKNIRGTYHKTPELEPLLFGRLNEGAEKALFGQPSAAAKYRRYLDEIAVRLKRMV
jgi:glycosyltransferase involved in cell wall biosynthesis